MNENNKNQTEKTNKETINITPIYLNTSYNFEKKYNKSTNLSEYYKNFLNTSKLPFSVKNTCIIKDKLKEIAQKNKGISSLTIISSHSKKKHNRSCLKTNLNFNLIDANWDKTKNNNAYYISGSLPFNSKYIVDKINPKLQKSNLSTGFISNSNINNESEMETNDKKIEKLARKLYLKKRQEYSPIDFHNNTIYLSNGFFNGVNLVMNPPNVEQNFLTDRGAVYSNGYNFVPTNLPSYLKDKFNIKGTTLLSPFCIKARDQYLYKKIFYDLEPKKIGKNNGCVDNKLNIIYAENEFQFEDKIFKINKKLLKLGRKLIKPTQPNSEGRRLIKCQKKIQFMKKIVDYAYPNMVLARVREEKKKLNKYKSLEQKLPSFKLADYNWKKKQKILDNSLTKSINVIKV